MGPTVGTLLAFVFCRYHCPYSHSMKLGEMTREKGYFIFDQFLNRAKNTKAKENIENFFQ